jgi:pimeloyl-ACP methyl ester carboxylesterase
MALAFATDTDDDTALITASSQCPFRTNDGVLLNVECFGPIYTGDIVDVDDYAPSSDDSTSSKSNNEWPLLLYVHGICESAETMGVQTLARYCAKYSWRLLVLELPGHGLSNNLPGRGRATCPNFDALVNHVVEFTTRMANKFSRAKGIVLAGGSLGGALCIYATPSMKHIKSEAANNSSSKKMPDFYGLALISPALGINPRAIPPSPVVTALRCLSSLLPSHGILTPIEDPSHYALPATSTRNFSGHWPLSTSAMLLDVTSHRIPTDIKNNHVHKQLEGLISLLVLMGDRDEIVPLSSVSQWFDSVTNLSSDTGEKTLITVKSAGHGFFHEDIRGTTTQNKHQKGAKDGFESLFVWLNSHSSK